MSRTRLKVILVGALLGHVAWAAVALQAQAKVASPTYATMAPAAQYMIASPVEEIALARSAAPKAISDGAEVLVLGPTGYTTAATGSNGFVCFVYRSFAAGVDDPVFWNPKVRGPVCMNAAAASTELPVVQFKAKMALAGKSAAEIGKAVEAAKRSRKLPPLAPGAMCYMMSRQQYLGDEPKAWHPHMMWFVEGKAVKAWGANLDGSPVMAGYVAEENSTTLMVVAEHWSDGSPAAAMKD
jgi:hypothetical protein